MPDSETPPIFKKWKSWYWLLSVVLVIQIIVFYLITESFQ
jgi:hypothetical protein